MTKIICPLLHNHYSLSSSGERMLCCISYYSLAYDQDHVAYKFDYEKDKLKALEAFEKGVFPPSCQGCQIDEKLGKKSYRQISTEMFPESTELVKQGKVEEIPIEFMDLKLGNKCNMGCRMCNPQSSSVLELENKTSKMFLENPENLNFNWPEQESYWEEIEKNSKTLKKIHLAGGEPLLVKEAKKYLERLVENKSCDQIELFINTNGSIFSEDWVELVKKFKMTTLYFSIDGVGNTYELIRFPAKWSLIEKNLKKWSSLAVENDNIEVAISSTVQIYNIFELKEILELTLSLEGFPDKIMMNILHYPHHFNIRNLPPQGKAQAKLYLMELLADYPHNSTEFRALISRLKEDASVEEFEKFVKVSEKYDNLRNQVSFHSEGGILSKLVKGDS